MGTAILHPSRRARRSNRARCFAMVPIGAAFGIATGLTDKPEKNRPPTKHHRKTARQRGADQQHESREKYELLSG